MARKLIAVLSAAALLSFANPALAQKKAAPENWDGMVKVKAKRVDLAYLLPNADFRGYTKVMIDPTQVSFRKNWQRDSNDMTAGTRVTDDDARRILDEAQKGFNKILAEAYQKAGYQVVTAPGADVLRLTPGLVDLDVEAPDTMSPGITRTYTHEAGGAIFVLEARDSLSNQLLGRAVDGQETSDFGPYIRNRATNAGAFEQLFDEWAKISVKALAELKEQSPINTAGMKK
ncbi:DUF3313 family protein [Sphingomonas sp. R-74633]|uniref:DUF3313 family protein n=1 Tax=Sphingomonas sp. R-74633 TaxID=2751188 RepID=UPI0015D3C57A|nr:DUF3313 family protein [Sphingomonas sp. R-74633]NYT42255.1 DUF3313 family protein [Sphingomonas sp. R-74633]